MLVLTRRVGQSIRIGNDIQVVIIGARGEQARLGIRAPKTIPVKGQAPPKRGEN
jgi:carbon storage regulator